jgi:hypothetical protein
MICNDRNLTEKMMQKYNHFELCKTIVSETIVIIRVYGLAKKLVKSFLFLEFV